MPIPSVSDYPRWYREMRQAEACDPLIGQPIRARVWYDRRYVYAGTIECRADMRFWIDEQEYDLYHLRVTNKPTWLGTVLVYREGGEWLVYIDRITYDDD